MINLKDYNIELHLVRHGSYTPTKVGGWTDDGLNTEGVSQIKDLFSKIDDNYDLFISSSLERAKESALILNEKLNMNILYNDNFREIDCGILNNMPVEEFMTKYSKDYFNTLGPDDSFPEGESQNSFLTRISDEFMKLLEEERNKKILLVTHSGVIYVILYLLGISDVNVETGSIIKLNQ